MARRGQPPDTGDLRWIAASYSSASASGCPASGSRPSATCRRDNTANLEMVPAMEPDLILDVGSVDDTNTSLADRCAFTPLAPPQPGDIQTGQSG